LDVDFFEKGKLPVSDSFLVKISDQIIVNDKQFRSIGIAMLCTFSIPQKHLKSFIYANVPDNDTNLEPFVFKTYNVFFKLHLVY